jgi:hypothetical protein
MQEKSDCAVIPVNQKRACLLGAVGCKRSGKQIVRAQFKPGHRDLIRDLNWLKEID